MNRVVSGDGLKTVVRSWKQLYGPKNVKVGTIMRNSSNKINIH